MVLHPSSDPALDYIKDIDKDDKVVIIDGVFDDFEFQKYSRGFVGHRVVR